MKLGLIGCGLIGRKRALAHKDFTVCAATDLQPRRARALCDECGGRAVEEAAGVINSEADIIVVATTHNQLAALALEALKAGKHVLLEKPGARTAAELEPVAELARARGLKVKVGFNHRFHPAVMKAKALVDEGRIGELMFIRGRYGHGGRVGYEREWRFNPEISGGGELLDQGSHLIDLSRWFLGEFPTVHGVLSRCFWPGQVEDNCFLTLVTARGQTAQLQATWTEWKNMFCLEIYGRSGKLQIDGLGGSYGLEQLALYKMRPQMGPPETVIWQFPFADRSWELEMEELARAVQEDRRPLGDVNDALENLRIIDALYQKGQRHDYR